MLRHTGGDQRKILGEPDIAFYHVDSEGQIQVVRCDGSHLSLLGLFLKICFHFSES